MEAPEKIFICDYGPEISYEWHTESEFEAKGHNDIEYTCTDTFIEKAIGWIDYNNRNGGCNFDGWEKDFKNYMEGD